MQVYDLSVSPNACFIANGVIVHNKTIAPEVAKHDAIGEWVGPDTFAVGYARLLLRADGTGAVAFRLANGLPVRLLHIREWRLGTSTREGQQIEFQVSDPVEPSAQEVVTGTAEHHQIKLGIKVSGDVRVFQLLREESVESSIESLRAKMPVFRK